MFGKGGAKRRSPKSTRYSCEMTEYFHCRKKSLISIEFVSHYDKQVVPLLRRMINLKELTLFLSVLKTYSTYIDNIQLHN